MAAIIFRSSVPAVNPAGLRNRPAPPPPLDRAARPWPPPPRRDALLEPDHRPQDHRRHRRMGVEELEVALERPGELFRTAPVSIAERGQDAVGESPVLHPFIVPAALQET